MTDASQPAWLNDYRVLSAGAGLVPLQDWSRLFLTGRDRAKFLHGLCTNDIKGLAAGQGCEAFVTNVQGKVIGHVLVLAGDERLEVVAPCGQAAALAAHWNRYLIREDVQIEDASATLAWFALAGDQADQVLQKCGLELPARRLAHGILGDNILGDNASGLRACRLEVVRPVWLVGIPRQHHEVWMGRLAEAGAENCAAAAWEALRIELGWPLFGQDITADNLPQEVNRDAAAISLTKGCYLGQETVARIDALGHVNRSLRGLRIGEGVTCEVGTPWHHEGKIIAFITSLAYSPRLGTRLALAYVRRAWEAPGSRLPLPAGQMAEVVALPIGGASASWNGTALGDT